MPRIPAAKSTRRRQMGPSRRRRSGHTPIPRGRTFRMAYFRPRPPEPKSRCRVCQRRGVPTALHSADAGEPDEWRHAPATRNRSDGSRYCRRRRAQPPRHGKADFRKELTVRSATTQEKRSPEPGSSRLLSAPSSSGHTGIPSATWALPSGRSTNQTQRAGPSGAVHSPGRCRLDPCVGT